MDESQVQGQRNYHQADNDNDADNADNADADADADENLLHAAQRRQRGRSDGSFWGIELHGAANVELHGPEVHLHPASNPAAVVRIAACASHNAHDACIDQAEADSWGGLGLLYGS